FHQREFTSLFGSGGKDLLEERTEDRPVCFSDEQLEAPAGQAAALQPEELCAGKIRQLNGLVGGQIEVAHRRKIEKIGVAFQGAGNFSAGRLEFLVLHL